GENANQQKAVATMDEVVVTGSRQEQATEKIPAQITVITAEDINASGAQSLPDVLRHLGGITVTDLNGNGFNQKIDMGGFGETSDRHVATVINGRKINSIDQSNVNFLSIPIENIEKIEVFHGGNSVLYGGDAMGGVINIITKDGQEGVHHHAEVGIGSFDTIKGTAGLSFGKGRFEGNIGAVRYDTDGYRDRSEADRTSVYGKLTFYAIDTLAVFLEANTTKADYQFPGGLTKAQMEQDRKQAINKADEGESQDNYYVLGVESDWGSFGKLDINLSYRDYIRDDTMISWGMYYSYEYDTVGFNPQYILDSQLFGNDNRLTIGMEMYDTSYDTWQGAAIDRNSRTKSSHDQTTLGLYLQDEFNLMQNLVLNLGARYEDFDTTLGLNPAQNKEIDENEYAWNLGVAYIFNPGSKLYARAYQAFRFPRVDEFLTYGVLNEDLKHETSRGYEIGARFVGMDNRLAMSGRFFTFDVDDEIAYNGATYLNENIDETRHQGGELNAKFQATNLLSLFSGLGYTNAEFTTGANNGKKIPLVPEFKANAGFGLDFACGFSYRFQYNYLGSRYAGADYSNSVDKLDSAGTVDMYATYTYKKVELFINATNIFNKKYHNGYAGTGWTSFYPMPEAVYYGGVRFKF
ncbi:MAG: TonB-dependent receptor, partial [Desulfobacterales bacterium]|nr:TonB-dependent receptor [Desulfobacterales bacterium]